MSSARRSFVFSRAAFAGGVAGAVTVALALGVLFGSRVASAQQITVDTILDDPTAGLTLREAIEQANGTMGPDVIDFDVDDFANDGVVSFDFDTAMPDITDELIINGASEGGYFVQILPPDTQDVEIDANLTLIDTIFQGAQSLQVNDPHTLRYESQDFTLETNQFTGGLGSLEVALIGATAQEVIFAGIVGNPNTTILTGATLRGDTNGLQKSILVDGTVIFEMPLETGDLPEIEASERFLGDISGSGSVIKDGDGKLIFTGTNTHTGSTQIWDGTLEGNTDNIQDEVYVCPSSTITCPNGTALTTLIFDQTTDGTFGGVLEGGGDLRKTGGGELVFDDDQSTFVGDLFIEDGRLTLEGAGQLGSPLATVEGGTFDLDGAIFSGGITVESGGTLTGASGSVGGSVSVASGGTISGSNMNIAGILDVSGRAAPGGVSTLTSDTAVFRSGASFAVLAQRDGSSGHLDVISPVSLSAIDATNTSVDVTFESGLYVFPRAYSLVSANSGSTTGFFLSETEFFGFTLALQAQDCVGGAGLCMDLTPRTGASFSSFATTENQLAIASALDAGDLMDPDFLEVYAAFNSTPLSEIPDIYDDLSGDQLAAFTNLRLAVNNRFNRGVSRRFDLERTSLTNLGAFQEQQERGARPDAMGGRRIARGAREANLGRHPGKGGWAAWLDMDGIFGSLDSNDGNTANSKYTIYGPLLGLDYGITDHLTVGGIFGYARADLDSRNRSTDGKADIYEGGIYLGAVWEQAYVTLAGRYASSAMKTTRGIEISSLDRTARAKFNGKEYSAFLEGAWNFEVPQVIEGFAVQPVVYLAYDHLRQDPFSEGGAGSLNLSVAKQEYDSLVTGIGARVGVKTQGVDGIYLHPQLRVAWERHWLDRWRHIDARLDAPSTTPADLLYQVEGARLPANMAVVGISTEAGLGDTLHLFLDYDARLASGFYENYLSLGFRKIF